MIVQSCSVNLLTINLSLCLLIFILCLVMDFSVLSNSLFINNKSCQSALLTNVSTININMLHKRLGHSALHTLKTVLKDSTEFTLNKSNNLNFCNACQFGKSHLLHFDSVLTKTIEPFQLLYADLWSPSHVTSTQG